MAKSQTTAIVFPRKNNHIWVSGYVYGTGGQKGTFNQNNTRVKLFVDKKIN